MARKTTGTRAARQPQELQTAIDAIVGQMAVIDRFGKAAEKVEGIAEFETGQFGIAVVMADGSLATGGDFAQPFPLQSISKVFAYTLALRAHGDELFKRVGREPSGDSFSSIIDLERYKGIPRNPFINSGALVVVDAVLDREKGDRTHATVREMLMDEIGEKKLGRAAQIVEDDGKKAGFGNRAHANLAKNFDNLHHDVEEVMKAYVENCAICLDCRQLALAGRYLMQDRRSGKSADEARLARRVNSLMMTCGMYDGSGEFAFRVGLPAKSGVGGGILAIVPGKASIAVWSPGLDDNGNSVLGLLALEQLAEKMDWSVFG
jgi:glutaminase